MLKQKSLHYHLCLLFKFLNEWEVISLSISLPTYSHGIRLWFPASLVTSSGLVISSSPDSGSPEPNTMELLTTDKITFPLTFILLHVKLKICRYYNNSFWLVLISDLPSKFRNFRWRFQLSNYFFDCVRFCIDITYASLVIFNSRVC